ncbi:otoancorin [Mantella aurantiaca]
MEFAEGIIIIGGDWNCVLDPSRDSSGGKSSISLTKLQRLSRFLSRAGLVDVWRILHPNERDFTYFSPVHTTYNRLDRLYVSQHALTMSPEATIGSILWSDHAPIYVKIDIPGPGPSSWSWRLNDNILKDTVCCAEIKCAIQQFVSDHREDPTSPNIQWEALKCTLRGILIAQGTRLKKIRSQDIKRGLERIEELERKHKKTPLSEIFVQLSEARCSLLSILHQKTLKARDKTRRLFYEFGDKPSKLLARALHAKNVSHHIAAIKTTSGDLTQAPDLIAEQFRRYYKDLYNLPELTPPVERENHQELLQSYIEETALPMVADPDREQLEEPFSKEELESVINSLVIGKSPGPDGYTPRFYKLFAAEIGPSMLKAFNAVSAAHPFPRQSLEAQIVVIPKEGKDPTLCSSYRPISLTNIDIRLHIAAMLMSLIRHSVDSYCPASHPKDLKASSDGHRFQPQQKWVFSTYCNFKEEPQTWAHRLLELNGPEVATTSAFFSAMANLYDDPMRTTTAESSLHPDTWTSDLKDKIKVYLYLQNLQEISNLQDISMFLNFETMRNKVFQCPIGNRTLFLLTYQKCLQALNSTDCVEILGQLLRMYGETYLDTDMIVKLPTDILDEPFRNLSSVFRDLYDKITASNQRAVYDWMTQTLQKSYPVYEVNGSSSWVTAESLWILGRLMVLLPLNEIKKINVNEIRIFISYDNATKQLDTVYDITQDLAKAFLELINSSGFDMRNISTIYRLGLLVCFYDDIQDIDSLVAKALLHQMIKCNQLRSFHADVQKLKAQLMHIATLNHTLNDSLGSLSDAVVALTISQLESLSPEAVQGAILTLQQVSGWTKSQIMILTKKYLQSEKNLTYFNVSQLGELVTGVSAELFYEMNSRELLLALKNGLSQHAPGISPAQQESILSKLMSSGEFQKVLAEMSGAFFKDVSLSQLSSERDLDVAVLKEKEMRTSQALFLFDLLSNKTTLENLLSTGQLVKGITCEQIDNINDSSHLKLIEKNLRLLSPFQIHCLAWKYWRVSKADIPPFLLAVLPIEYFASYPLVCKKLLISLRKIDLNYMLLNENKKQTVINKVNQCLNGSIADVYQLDMLGSLICHLFPSIIRNATHNVIASAINQLKACSNLSHEQNQEIKYRILQYYGNPLNWSSEIAQDMVPFWNLLSKEEIMTVMLKFQNLAPRMVSEAAGIPQGDEMLLALHNAIWLHGTNDSVATDAECMDTTVLSSDTIVLLGEANCLWSLKELQCMSMETFAKTVHILGGLRHFNQSQLSALKEKGKLLWGPLSEWKSYHIIALGHITTALNASEIDELDLGSIDTVSALSQQTKWTGAQAKSILHGFLNDSGKSVQDLKSFELAGLGGSLCAAEPEQIIQIKPKEFRSVISRLGYLSCSPNILQAFKKQAEIVYGKVETWSHFILNDIGCIAAALSEEDFKDVDPRLMPYIQPAAISLIPDQIFKDLSAEHISNLGPVNGAMVTESQHALLNSSQLQGLRQALEGIRISINRPQSLTTQSATTATSLTSVSLGAALTAGYIIIVGVISHLLYS